jgi:glucosamine-6-phosphate deaminase
VSGGVPAPASPLLRVFETEADVAYAAARLIADRLSAGPRITIGLATGRTPIPLYRELVGLYRAGGATFAHATTVNLDEFLGPADRSVGCYRAFMNRHLFDHVNIDPARIQFLNHRPIDPAEECARYERAIAAAGGIDVQVLGLGANGHIGFNEPAAALSACTHEVRLTRQTRAANAALFGGRVGRVPRRALSMGMGTILRARSIVLLATGASKARPIRAALRGPVTTRFPASFLQLHADVVVFVDRAAGKLMTGENRP